MKDQYNFRWIYLPYCLQQLGPDLWVVLNRQYKPLGISKKDWVDYALHAVKMKITPATIKKVAEKVVVPKEGEFTGKQALYLYGDGSVPTRSAEHWNNYQARLKALANIKTEGP